MTDCFSGDVLTLDLGFHDGLVLVNSKRVLLGVHHGRFEIKSSQLVVALLFFGELIVLLLLDVVPDDFDILVPIGPLMLVSESEGMKRFMNDGRRIHCILCQDVCPGIRSWIACSFLG